MIPKLFGTGPDKIQCDTVKVYPTICVNSKLGCKIERIFVWREAMKRQSRLYCIVTEQQLPCQWAFDVVYSSILSAK